MHNDDFGDHEDDEVEPVLSAMRGLDGEPLYYKFTTVARILHAASLPAIPLPDDIQGDPKRIVAYFIDWVDEIQIAKGIE